MRTYITKTALVVAASLTVLSFTNANAQDPAATATAPQPQVDPVGEHLFPPELILQQAEQLNLGTDQKEAIEKDVAAAQKNMVSMQERLQAELKSLSAMLEDQSNDQTAVLGQLDKVLKEERNVKRLHLQLLLRIRGQLSADQQTQLQELKGKILAARALQQRLNAKLQRVQQGLKRLSALGDPPAEYMEKIQKFQQLAKDGDIVSAEAEIDALLLQLEGSTTITP